MGFKTWVSIGALALSLGACGNGGGTGALANANAGEHVVGGKTASEVFVDDARLEALARAACVGDVAAMNTQIEAGVDVNARGFMDATALVWAMDCGNVDGVARLLAAGADPNQDFGRATPVLLAAGNKNPALLKLVLENGGDPNAAYPNSINSALYIALGMGMDEFGWDNYWTLVEAGADLEQVNGGRTVIEIAVGFQRYDLVIDALERGYDFRLEVLGRRLQGALERTRQPDITRKGEELKRMLEERGVSFPVPLIQVPPPSDR